MGNIFLHVESLSSSITNCIPVYKFFIFPCHFWLVSMFIEQWKWWTPMNYLECVVRVFPTMIESIVFRGLVAAMYHPLCCLTYPNSPFPFLLHIQGTERSKHVKIALLNSKKFKPKCAWKSHQWGLWSALTSRNKLNKTHYLILSFKCM